MDSGMLLFKNAEDKDRPTDLYPLTITYFYPSISL